MRRGGERRGWGEEVRGEGDWWKGGRGGDGDKVVEKRREEN